MKIGLIGLGKMGMNLAENMIDNNIEVVAYDIDQTKADEATEKSILFSSSVEHCLEQLDEDKIIWMMIPAGKPTEDMFQRLLPLLSAGDRLIDGGNSHFEDSKRRAAICRERQIYFFDVGTSGGMDGARNGACMMIGGDKDQFARLEPLFDAVNVQDGYLYTGESGSGHYLKMVHNGIEYGMMQAIGEGFDVLHHSEFDFDLAKVAKVWNNGSVIRSWLMELAQDFFEEDADLEEIEGVIGSSGEGKWTVDEALNLNVPVPVIAQSLMVRYASSDTERFGAKVVASLRNGFGGHEIVNKGGKTVDRQAVHNRS